MDDAIRRAARCNWGDNRLERRSVHDCWSAAAEFCISAASHCGVVDAAGGQERMREPQELPQYVCGGEAAQWRDGRDGAGRHAADCGPAGDPVSGIESGSGRERAAAVGADRWESAADFADAAGRGRTAVGDCVRECGESSAGAVREPAAGDCGAGGAGGRRRCGWCGSS